MNQVETLDILKAGGFLEITPESPHRITPRIVYVNDKGLYRCVKLSTFNALLHKGLIELTQEARACGGYFADIYNFNESKWNSKCSLIDKPEKII